MTHATLENQDMGRVLVSAKVENLADVWDREKGDLSADAVRSVEVNGALVDTGCTLLGLPRRMIDVLGLTPLQTRQIRTATGLTEARLYNSVRLTIQDRICNTDVMEIPDHCPVLVGQIPLELLDFVISPAQQKLIGNPEHGGEQMYELFSFL